MCSVELPSGVKYSVSIDKYCLNSKLLNKYRYNLLINVKTLLKYSIFLRKSYVPGPTH